MEFTFWYHVYQISWRVCNDCISPTNINLNMFMKFKNLSILLSFDYCSKCTTRRSQVVCSLPIECVRWDLSPCLIRSRTNLANVCVDYCLSPPWWVKYSGQGQFCPLLVSHIEVGFFQYWLEKNMGICENTHKKQWILDWLSWSWSLGQRAVAHQSKLGSLNLKVTGPTPRTADQLPKFTYLCWPQARSGNWCALSLLCQEKQKVK